MSDQGTGVGLAKVRHHTPTNGRCDNDRHGREIPANQQPIPQHGRQTRETRGRDPGGEIGAPAGIHGESTD